MTKPISDIEKVGKRTPYTTPDEFFEKMQARVWSQINQPQDETITVPHTASEDIQCRTEKRKGKRNIALRWLAMTIPAAAVAAGFLFLPHNDPPETPQLLTGQSISNIDWVEQLTDEELEAYSVFVDNDVFMYQ